MYKHDQEKNQVFNWFLKEGVGVGGSFTANFLWYAPWDYK